MKANLWTRIRAKAPWPIPLSAREQKQDKGYRQYKFSWQKNGWRYEARYHSVTPLAEIISYPSWRLDRVCPGQGFGPDHRRRLSQSRVGQHWLATSYLRFCARQVIKHQASQKQIEIVKKAHFKSKSYD